VLNGPRVGRVLRALATASRPEHVDLRGFNRHSLKGPPRWAIRVTGNWRISFGWDGAETVAVDLEDSPLTSERRTGTGLPAMHPGELLREEILPALGCPRAEIARLLGVSRQALHAVLAERAAVTTEMALRLGKLCGNGPELWLALQTRYDLERLRREKAAEIDAIPTLQAA
jgi:antitoxin HigA-1